jgi:hypothetical protein
VPEHKMIVIGGVRYRPEDAPQVPDTEPDDGVADAGSALTSAAAVPPPAGPFDPSAHNADAVLAHLAAADPAESARVLEAERAGKARAGVLRWTPPAPALPQVPDVSPGGDGGPAA